VKISCQDGYRQEGSGSKGEAGKVGDGMSNVKTKERTSTGMVLLALLATQLERLWTFVYHIILIADTSQRSAKKVKTPICSRMVKRNETQPAKSPRQPPTSLANSQRQELSPIESGSETRGHISGCPQLFREAMAERASDPYQVLRSNKLPMSLIRDGQGKNGLQAASGKNGRRSCTIGDTFGPKAQRKRVKLGVGSLEDLAGKQAKCTTPT
jgi:hypothetical protein